MIDLSKYEGIAPDEWRAVPPTENHGWYVESDVTGRSICDMYFIDRDGTDKLRHFEDAMRNARAIAGLPDILAYARELEARNAELVGEKDLYVIWSTRYHAWRGSEPDRYVKAVERASVYSREQAISISFAFLGDWQPGERPNDIPVRVADLPGFARAALSRAKGEGK